MGGAQKIEDIRRQAARLGLNVADEEHGLPFERCLVLGAGVAVPWGLVQAGLRFVERWEVATPLADELAHDVGAATERERTVAVIRDLRVPTYVSELLFVRKCEAAEALLAAWREEGGGRLAFLRALYRVKPCFLALPRSWLRPMGAVVATGPQVTETPDMVVKPGPHGLVRVKVGPGRYVRCRPGEEQLMVERFSEHRRQR